MNLRVEQDYGLTYSSTIMRTVFYSLYSGGIGALNLHYHINICFSRNWAIWQASQPMLLEHG